MTDIIKHHKSKQMSKHCKLSTVYTTELRRMTNKPTQNISQITVKMWHRVDKE